jgi:hypothetical protein
VPPASTQEVEDSALKPGTHLLPKYPPVIAIMMMRTTRTIIAIIIALRDRPWALDGIFMKNKK